MTTAMKLDGHKVTDMLMALELRTDLGFEVEMEVEVNDASLAKGHINFLNVGWDYEYKGESLVLELNDAETHFDHIWGLDGEKIGEHECEVQETMEGITKIPTVVNIV